MRMPGYKAVIPLTFKLSKAGLSFPIFLLPEVRDVSPLRLRLSEAGLYRSLKLAFLEQGCPPSDWATFPLRFNLSKERLYLLSNEGP